MALHECAECHGQVSDMAQACPHCGAPVGRRSSVSVKAAAPPKPGLQASPQPSRKPPAKKVTSTHLKMFGVVLFFALAFAQMLSKPTASSSSAPVRSSTDNDYRGSAFTRCEEYVLGRLKAPSTARFSLRDAHVVAVTSDTYAVRSHVDSENEFGVQVRTNFRCEVQFNGGEPTNEDSWTLVSLSLE